MGNGTGEILTYILLFLVNYLPALCVLKLLTYNTLYNQRTFTLVKENWILTFKSNQLKVLLTWKSRNQTGVLFLIDRIVVSIE